MNNSSALHLRQAEIQFCEKCSAMPFHHLYQLIFCFQIQFKILIIIKWHRSSLVGFPLPFKEEPLLCASFRPDQRFHLQSSADAEKALRITHISWNPLHPCSARPQNECLHGLRQQYTWLEWGKTHRGELEEMWTDL